MSWDLRLWDSRRDSTSKRFAAEIVDTLSFCFVSFCFVFFLFSEFVSPFLVGWRVRVEMVEEGGMVEDEGGGSV